MSDVLAVALGVLIGALLGGLGGGGAVLTVPTLFFLAGQSPHAAATGSLVVVGVSASAALVVQGRAGRVCWRTGGLTAASGIGTAAAGAALSPLLPARVELLSLALVMTVCGVLLLLRGRYGEGGGRPVPHAGRRTALVGGTVGLLTGLLGVGGGFLVVPALVLALRMPVRTATGTAVLVTAVNCAAALPCRLPAEDLDWRTVVPLTGAALAGALLGSRLSGRIPARTLSRAFATVVLAVATLTAVHTLAT
ncbi:UPF0721 transmembrane protein [Pilimelia terevasa]|uniref:Probable membrane transporter protein n=1 Tax=Pilimelia terevasa TaxID=53372 RepID=A0A8J3BTH3_9ACTN|nr:sulfite exporter TauE/SafE family protein [Pilimelia terevasa]GGK39867.1 UPF0721 transmembrane protein [Pilimelia terevasa]